MPISQRPIHNQPYTKTPKPGFDRRTGQQHAQLATNNAVYHPTKGWRTIRAFPSRGHYKIEEFLRRAFK